MPSIKILCRKASIASDDVPFPAFLCAIAHFILAIFAIFSLATNSDNVGNSKDSEIVTYIAAILGLILAALVIELLILYFGSQGTSLDI